MLQLQGVFDFNLCVNVPEKQNSGALSGRVAAIHDYKFYDVVNNNNNNCSKH